MSWNFTLHRRAAEMLFFLLFMMISGNVFVIQIIFLAFQFVFS